MSSKPLSMLARSSAPRWNRAIEAFVERIEHRLEEHGTASERALKARRNHQKEMVLGAMGIGVPLLAIGAIFTGLAGVIAVCAAIAIVAIVSTR
jgi:hypothetical protein